MSISKRILNKRNRQRSKKGGVKYNQGPQRNFPQNNPLYLLPAAPTGPPEEIKPIEPILSPEEIKVEIKKAEKKAEKKKALTAALSNIKSIAIKFKDYRTNIVLLSYDSRYGVLTISYPRFDITGVDEGAEFTNEFINLCSLDGLHGIISSINILFHETSLLETYKEYARQIEDETITNGDYVDILYELGELQKTPLLQTDQSSPNAIETVKTMSSIIYSGIIAKNTVYQDNDDFNSPKSDKRLQLANDGDNLTFYLDPGGHNGKFAPTGHGGRNGFIEFNSADGTKFLCANIGDRRGKAFNGFGGAPDYNEEDLHTVIREMIEEVFEKLYRNKDVEQTSEPFLQGLQLLGEILKNNSNEFTDLTSVRTYLHNLDELSEEQLSHLFERVILTKSTHAIDWSGLSFPNHKLPSGKTVVSNTTYFLSRINTSFSADKIIKILQSTYAHNEIYGVFIIKTTPGYIEFFSRLYNSLMATCEHRAEIEQILQKTDPNEFLYIVYDQNVYTTGFSLKLEIDKDKDNPSIDILTINIGHDGFRDTKGKPTTIRLFQICVASPTLKPISKTLGSEADPFYINGSASEIFFVEVFRLMEHIVPPPEIQGGQNRRNRRNRTKRTKSKKSRRSRRKSTKKRKYRN
jgi:hypothetical protein